MTAELAFANCAARGLARVLPGLALVAVVACGSDTDELARWATEHSGAQPAAAEPVPTPAAVTPGYIPPPTEPEPADDEPSAESVDPEPAVEEIRGNFAMWIPALDVTAPVVPIEMTADLVLEPPADPSVVGWWSQGAAPGAEQGSAVLVGHSVRTGGGALNEAASLTGGDVIEIVGPSHTLTYQVESVEVLSKDELAEEAERIFDQLGPGRLVVITCEDWDGSVWRSNVVATARLS